ncbi:MAG: DUF350 domain-containing protein, partial [Planctomycetota bacterium]
DVRREEMVELMWFLYSAGYLVLAVAFLLLAKKLFDLLTPYSVTVQLTEKDNPAVGVLLTGFLLGVAAVICGVFVGEGPDQPSLTVFVDEIVQVVVYGIFGVCLLFWAGIINDKVVLRKFSNRKEIIESRNSAVAVIVAATYIGSGLVIAGAIQGSAHIVAVLVCFLVGQVALVGFAIVYQAATPYDDQKELGEGKNVAAGIAFGGSLLAFSLILMKGLTVRFEEVEEWTWSDRLVNFAYYAVAGCVLLVLARIVVDRLFLPKAKLSKEIVQDRNLNAGLIEAALAGAIGATLVFCL